MNRTDKITLGIFIAALVFIVVMSSGCKSLPGTQEVDTPFFDIEYEGAKEE